MLAAINTMIFDLNARLLFVDIIPDYCVDLNVFDLKKHH